MRISPASGPWLLCRNWLASPTPYTLQLGRLQLVRPGEIAEQGGRHRLPEVGVGGTDVAFYQKILVDQGAVGTLLAARTGDAYQLKDPFFGGQMVWQDFSNWLGQIPAIRYGTYTAEVDAAVEAQLPTIAKGGSVDDALKAINEQAKGQIQ